MRRHGVVLTSLAGRAAVGVTLALLAATGCVVEAEPEIAPALAPGDLVITELRGPQSGSDDRGQFIELYNATGDALDLRGLVIRLYRLDGSSEARVIVRQPLPVAAGGYAVLGPGSALAALPYVDYAMENDMTSDLFPAGAVDVSARGVQIDRVVYGTLPPSGSYSLGATEEPPSADANDVDGAWCPDLSTDDTIDDELAIGSPGLENAPCDA